MKKPPYTVSDYILDFLVSQGVERVFVLTGGAIAFVVDAFSRRDDIKYVAVAHEQAAAMMGEAYSRVGPGLSACMVTSGPGTTNLITGICCAWCDSIPTMYISGQVNTYEQKGAHPGTENARQVGFQETDIVSMVGSVTKYAVMLKRAEDIRYELEKAAYIAKSGRPGPVIIDIPMNFQRVEVEPKKLKPFIPPKALPYEDTGVILAKKVSQTWGLLTKAERPVLVSGGGVRLGQAVPEFLQLVKLTGFPIVTSWSGFDTIAYDHPQLIGAQGVYGSRSANYTVQNSDVLLTVGSRLDTRQTGGRPETYARGAKVIMVDIDKGELTKRRGLIPTLEIATDAKEFLREMIAQYPRYRQRLPTVKPWLNRAQAWKAKYPNLKPEYFDQKKYVNPYVFGEILSQELGKNAVVVSDTGSQLACIMQSFKIKQGQRLFSAFGNSPMGYAFPAAIGASIALGKKDVICINGDGAFQFNAQELQTVVHNKIPVKIFIFNNQGYNLIKQFIDMYLDKRLEAVSPRGGVTAPDFVKLGKVYGVPGVTIKHNRELRKKIRWALTQKGAVIVDIHIDPEQKIAPKLAFGKPIEDSTPLLPREEFATNMLIPTIDADTKLTEAN